MGVDLLAAKTEAIVRCFALFIAALICVYLVEYRYHLRWVPVTPGILAALDNAFPGEIHGRFVPRGVVDLPSFDVASDDGVKSAVAAVRRYSPWDESKAKPVSLDATFDTWLAHLRTHHGYCTDMSLLFQSIAWQSGFPTRQWWIFNGVDNSGSAHAVVEVYDPSLKRWRLVDANTGTLVYRADGSPAGMLDLIASWRSNRPDDIRYVRQEVAEFIGIPANISMQKQFGPTPLDAPTLSLTPPSWYADYSNLRVIALSVMSGGSGHNPHVWLTKLAVIGLMTALIIAARPRFGLRWARVPRR